ncbi:MAG: DUF1549 and DUF1553 domain-containing protein [Gemmataceae bacterium]|nr:DUF1549 and DUF1553 domain-containing protein [Gemmataceae bacterium]
MSTTSLAYRWRRALPLGLGACALWGLALAFAPEAPAQAKKAPAEAKDEPEINTDPKFRDVMVGAGGGVEQVAYINELIEKGWKENKIAPSPRCSDFEFIRRASLDIIGRIATVKEIGQFMADPPERRRSLLIERLLKSPEFGENFGNLWTVMLLTRSGSRKVHQEQMREWLTEHFNNPSKDGWAETAANLISATGVTNENPAVNFVLHHLGEPIPQNEQPGGGKFDMVPVTSRTTKLFLGLRTQCVQCHDHPFSGEWEQKHFWGINAFFRSSDAPRGRPQTNAPQKKGKGIKEAQRELVDRSDLNSDGKVQYERRNATIYFAKATFLDGKRLPEDATGSRRQELAKFVTNSPYFSKVFVNRMWHHFMGKSFTKDAPDDFGEHNPASHPELLDRLAEDWAKKYSHNPKDLVRWICNSRAYGLSSVAHKGNDKPEDEVFFARMLLKPMSPEQLFDSLMTATDAKVGQDKTERRALKEAWLEQLVVNFGNDEGEEGTFNGTVVQALMLMNGKEMNDAIMDQKDGTVAAAIRKRANPREAMKDLYLAALNRPPTTREYTAILSDPRMRELPRVPPTAQSASWTAYYQDIFWAILNSNEFILNH